MEDGIEEFMVRFPPDFPLQAVIEIADELMADGGIANGRFPSCPRRRQFTRCDPISA